MGRRVQSIRSSRIPISTVTECSRPVEPALCETSINSTRTSTVMASRMAGAQVGASWNYQPGHPYSGQQGWNNQSGNWNQGLSRSVRIRSNRNVEYRRAPIALANNPELQQTGGFRKSKRRAARREWRWLALRCRPAEAPDHVIKIECALF